MPVDKEKRIEIITKHINGLDIECLLKMCAPSDEYQTEVKLIEEASRTNNLDDHKFFAGQIKHIFELRFGWEQGWYGLSHFLYTAKQINIELKKGESL